MVNNMQNVYDTDMAAQYWIDECMQKSRHGSQIECMYAKTLILIVNLNTQT